MQLFLEVTEKHIDVSVKVIDFMFSRNDFNPVAIALSETLKRKVYVSRVSWGFTKSASSFETSLLLYNYMVLNDNEWCFASPCKFIINYDEHYT